MKPLRGGGDFVTPSVSLIGETDVRYNVPPPPMAGDVAYWNGSKIKTSPLSSYNTSLGAAVGVVVIPAGFAPDGKTRITFLGHKTSSGSYTSKQSKWGISGETGLTNYTKWQSFDNQNLVYLDPVYAKDSNCVLPSDKFDTEYKSYLDSKSSYYGENGYKGIVSPYINNEAPNPDYYKYIDGGNVFSDFGGLHNTEHLVNLSSDYTAAQYAWNYEDGYSNLQWYLPAMGELGYLIARFSTINNTLGSLGGCRIIASTDGYKVISSTVLNTTMIASITPRTCRASKFTMTGSGYLHPFAIID